MSMRISPTSLPGVSIVETSFRVDQRGAFARLFCEQELHEILGNRHIVQINQSRTMTVGALRGMHYQRAPHAEMKLIRCIKGRVWDVAVDIRRDSPTFLQWHAEELSAENGRMLVVPEGCAHGFQVLEPGSEMLYLHTASYAQHAEGGLAYNDPRCAISWPLPVTDLSDGDNRRSFISSDFSGIAV
jgi:dTDP-4-dehydrorhamnose 3,5-epimerase